MVLVEIIGIKNPFSLRIKRARGVRKREKRISLNVIILLLVVDMVGGTLASV